MTIFPLIGLYHIERSEADKVSEFDNEYVGLFNIKTFEMFEGDLPQKAQELVSEWMRQHSDELQAMWDNQVITKLPPL